MDRSRIVVKKLSDRRFDGFVPGTPAERIALVWQLTVEACALSKRYDAERPLQRHKVRLLRRKPPVDEASADRAEVTNE